MTSPYIPKDYKPKLDLYETQMAIGTLKRVFEDNLSKALNLKRVSAPLFVESNSGLNDTLSGTERPVMFTTKEDNIEMEIVHSLAKWKRMALYKYNFSPGEGLYTDMNAIRRDEVLDNTHSIYVDQWDWERVISAQDRTLDFLKEIVKDIIASIYETYKTMKSLFPMLNGHISENLVFVTSQELEDMYPDLTPQEREDVFTKEHKTVFLMQIGKVLNSGKKHDGRAPDYDDWELNGDILMYNPVLDKALEISSMGIRVDAKALDKQLKAAGCDERREYLFHKMLLNNQLPLTIGGGIGQSRLCMLMLQKAHIGEVQVSIWDENTRALCRAANVPLL